MNCYDITKIFAFQQCYIWQLFCILFPFRCLPPAYPMPKQLQQQIERPAPEQQLIRRRAPGGPVIPPAKLGLKPPAGIPAQLILRTAGDQTQQSQDQAGQGKGNGPHQQPGKGPGPGCNEIENVRHDHNHHQIIGQAQIRLALLQQKQMQLADFLSCLWRGLAAGLKGLGKSMEQPGAEPIKHKDKPTLQGAVDKGKDPGGSPILFADMEKEFQFFTFSHKIIQNQPRPLILNYLNS